MQKPTDARDFGEHEWGQSAARREAAGLAVLVSEQNAETLRADILISPGEAVCLRRIMDARDLQRLIDFRLSIAREFDRLVASRLDAIRADTARRHARLAERSLTRAKQNKIAQARWRERQQQREAVSA